MSVNRHRGEIEAVLDGVPRRLCLTLAALAELESAFGVEDLASLLARFGEGRLSSADMARIIGSGLRGGGASTGDDEVVHMQAEGGATGFARIVADLLNATFGAGEPPPNP